MKIKSAIYTLLILLLVTFLGTSVSADDEILTWSADETTKSITVVEGAPVTYCFIPNETGEYALKRQNWKPLGYELSANNGEHPEFQNWMDDNNNSYDIFQLTAGTEYTIMFFFNGPDPAYDGTYTEEISLAPWNNKVIIPDHPYIQDNDKITVTLAADECEYYLYSPSESGTYCVGRNTSNVRVNLSPVLQAPNQIPHDPEYLDSWNTDNQQGSLFHLESGNLYLVCIQAFGIPHDSTVAADTVWIRPGEAPKNEYPTWDINDTKTVSLQKEEIVKYYLTPSKSGKYMVRTTEGIRFEVIGDAGDMLGTEFITSDGTEGIVFDLTAGKQYVLMIQEWGSFEDSITGTFRFEKVGAVKSASIYVANFTNEFYILGIDIDPICGGLEGVTWSVSDPSVFSIVYQSDNGVELNILKKGKATVTAKVGKVSTSIELTSDPKLPVLTEGNTLDLTIGGSAAAFTPAKSGKYQFKVIPNRSMLFSVFYNIEQDPIYFKEEFSDNLVFTLNLDAGHTYELVQLFGRSSVSVKYAGGSSSQDGTTAPTTAPTQPSTVAPTSPAQTPTESTQAPTEPTQSTGPISTDATAPTIPTETQPDNDSVGTPIMRDDITEAIKNTTGQVITFSSAEISKGFRLSADALQLAADENCSIAFEFPGNIAVQLDNSVLKFLGVSAEGDDVSIQATQLLYSALNENQQKALDGKSIICLLDIELMVGNNSIHQLGGTAQISFSNIDTNKDWSVLYLADDGIVEVMDVALDGNISFSTDHFSYYALILNQQQTGTLDNGWILPVVIALIVIAGGGTAAFIVIKKERNK